MGFPYFFEKKGGGPGPPPPFGQNEAAGRGYPAGGEQGPWQGQRSLLSQGSTMLKVGALVRSSWFMLSMRAVSRAWSPVTVAAWANSSAWLRIR